MDFRLRLYKMIGKIKVMYLGGNLILFPYECLTSHVSNTVYFSPKRDRIPILDT